jgi:hypothetical protein
VALQHRLFFRGIRVSGCHEKLATALHSGATVLLCLGCKARALHARRQSLCPLFRFTHQLCRFDAYCCMLSTATMLSQRIVSVHV